MHAAVYGYPGVRSLCSEHHLQLIGKGTRLRSEPTGAPVGDALPARGGAGLPGGPSTLTRRRWVSEHPGPGVACTGIGSQLPPGTGVGEFMVDVQLADTCVSHGWVCSVAGVGFG